MLKKNMRTLLQLARRLWVRVAMLSALSVLAAVIAPVLAPLLPWEASERFDRGAIEPILNILASGMLVVTTFSLNVMVSAYRNAAGQATPRAYRLLLEDTTTQTVLATFTGAFIYALSALLFLNVGFYEGKAILVVFGTTVLVLVLIILAILRWIDHLSSLGNMDHTMQVIENRAAAIMTRWQEAPAMGGRPVTADHPMPRNSRPLRARETGYVAFIDMAALQEAMEATQGRMRLLSLPGSFVAKGEAMAYFSRGRPASEAEGDSGDKGFDLSDLSGSEEDPDTDAALRKSFDIRALRSFDQDPRYGLTVLAEIGVRALSPGVNDPGTAIEAIHRIERLLWDHGGLVEGPDAHPDAADEPPYPRIESEPYSAGALVESGLGPLTRHVRTELDALRHLAASCTRLSRHPDDTLAQAARDLSRSVMDRADAAGIVAADRDEILRILDGKGETPTAGPGQSA